jgi:hypothetical protein
MSQERECERARFVVACFLLEMAQKPSCPFELLNRKELEAIKAEGEQGGQTEPSITEWFKAARCVNKMIERIHLQEIAQRN